MPMPMSMPYHARYFRDLCVGACALLVSALLAPVSEHSRICGYCSGGRDDWVEAEAASNGLARLYWAGLGRSDMWWFTVLGSSRIVTESTTMTVSRVNNFIVAPRDWTEDLTRPSACRWRGQYGAECVREFRHSYPSGSAR
ncbi:hypothetical protein LZ30DRAFT_692910 [Colletotrichum cereale]|nr:hypothetical protein LZ30DRAFT_692910 [Colletotrichum cereale]